MIFSFKFGEDCLVKIDRKLKEFIKQRNTIFSYLSDMAVAIKEARTRMEQH